MPLISECIGVSTLKGKFEGFQHGGLTKGESGLPTQDASGSRWAKENHLGLFFKFMERCIKVGHSAFAEVETVRRRLKEKWHFSWIGCRAPSAKQ